LGDLGRCRAGLGIVLGGVGLSNSVKPTLAVRFLGRLGVVLRISPCIQLISRCYCAWNSRSLSSQGALGVPGSDLELLKLLLLLMARQATSKPVICLLTSYFVLLVGAPRHETYRHIPDIMYAVHIVPMMHISDDITAEC
jgi:hypothetical protein